MEQQHFLTVSPTFVLRKTKGSRPTNIYLSFTYNGKQVKLSTGVKVYPDHWDKDKQEAVISHRLTKLDNKNNLITNERISELKKCFNECILYLCENPTEIEEGKGYIKTIIYKDMVNKGNKLKVLATIQMRQILQEKRGVGDSTMVNYEAVIRRVKKYLNDNNIPDSWDSIDYNFLKQYEGTFTNYDTYKTNFATLLWILERADKIKEIEYDRKEKDTLRYEIRKRTEEDEKEKIGIALSKEEVKRIYNYTPLDGYKENIRNYRDSKSKMWHTKEYIIMVRNMFTLQCLTGQRISDIIKVVETEPKEGCITLYTQKRKTIAIIPIESGILEDEWIKRLIKDIKRNTLYKSYRSKNCTLVNNTLSFIAKEVGLDRKVSNKEDEILLGLDAINGIPIYNAITSHDGRTTLVTELCKRDRPISKEDIITITGHKSTKMVDDVYSILSIDDKRKRFKDSLDMSNRDKMKEDVSNISNKDSIDSILSNLNPFGSDNIPIEYYGIDRDVDISKYNLTDPEREFLSNTLDTFEVGVASLKIRKVLDRLIQFGIVVRLK